MLPHTAWAPTLAQPVVAVHAEALRKTLDENDNVIEHPVRNANRVIIPNGPVITTLPTLAAGLVAAGSRAVCWFQTETAMEFMGLCLATATVKDRFVLKGATKAGARIIGRDILVWERDTLHLFHDLSAAS